MDNSPGGKLLSTSSNRQAPSVSQSGGDKSGPTGSSRLYPKGKGSGLPDASKFNPMNTGKSTYGLEGK